MADEFEIENKSPEKVLSLDSIIQRQKKLEEKIQELAQNSLMEEEQIIKVLSFFRDEIYSDGFRHNYSGFFPVVTKICEGNNSCSSQTLIQNIADIKQMLSEELKKEDSCYKDVYSPIFKMCDHVTLEIYRFESTSKMLSELEGVHKELEFYQEKIKEVNKKLKKSEEALKKSEEMNKKSLNKISKMQGETIGVISIFAAVTLAFSGGISYLSSAISAIHNSPILKLLLTILICGFVLVNTIFVLLYVVAKMVDKGKFMSCNTEDCKSCKVRGTGEKNIKRKVCSSLKKMRHKFPYIFWIDIILLGMVVGICSFMVFQKHPQCPNWLK